MARCPGSGKRCVPQLLRRFKGLLPCSRAGLVTPERRVLRARCWLVAWTEPDNTRHAGQQRSRWEIDLGHLDISTTGNLCNGMPRAASAAARAQAELMGTAAARIHFWHSAFAGVHFTWYTRDLGCPHAYLAEDPTRQCCSAAPYAGALLLTGTTVSSRCARRLAGLA
jgi:hypothetical protein